MKMIPWRPFFGGYDDMNLFMRPYQSMMTNVDAGIVPPLDMYETENDLVIETPLAGVDPSKVDIMVDGDMLTLKGETERKTEIDEKNYYRKEVRSGSVYRQIPLPVPVLGENASASYEQGMLKIIIPKKSSEQAPIKINIRPNDDQTNA